LRCYLAHLRRYLVQLRCYLVHLRRYLVHLRCYLVHLRCYLVQLRRYLVQLRCYLAHLRRYLVQLRGHSARKRLKISPFPQIPRSDTPECPGSGLKSPSNCLGEQCESQPLPEASSTG
jgi:hypothetical protein